MKVLSEKHGRVCQYEPFKGMLHYEEGVKALTV